MPQSEEKSLRITSGPIEDLGLVVDQLIKKGFVYIHPVLTPHEAILRICTQFGVEEVRMDKAKNPNDEVLGYVYNYLSKNNMYLARASMRSISLMVISGDLYKKE